MENCLTSAVLPHLPDRPIKTVVVSEEAEQIIAILQAMKLNVLTVKRCDILDSPVASHTDMQLLPLGQNHFLISPHQTQLKSALESLGATVTVGEDLGKEYPMDVLYNAVRLGDSYICNERTVSKTALQSWNGLKRISVKQGYTKCSVCVVDERSIITADAAIAKASKSAGITVLQIRPGYIQIPKYDTGFIGGCAGKLGPDVIAFTGKLCSHPDGKIIKEFLEQRKINIIELTDKPLFDIGSIIPI